MPVGRANCATEGSGFDFKLGYVFFSALKHPDRLEDQLSVIVGEHLGVPCLGIK